MKINYLFIAALVLFSNIASAAIVVVSSNEKIYYNGVQVESWNPYAILYGDRLTLETGAEITFGADDLFGIPPFQRSKIRTTTFAVTDDAPFSLSLTGYIQFGSPTANVVASLFEDGALLTSHQVVAPGSVFNEQSYYGTLLSGKTYSLRFDMALHSRYDSVNPVYVNALIEAVPVPPAFLLMLSGLSSLAGAGLLRRRIS